MFGKKLEIFYLNNQKKPRNLDTFDLKFKMKTWKKYPLFWSSIIADFFSSLLIFWRNKETFSLFFLLSKFQ